MGNVGQSISNMVRLIPFSISSLSPKYRLYFYCILISNLYIVLRDNTTYDQQVLNIARRHAFQMVTVSSAY